MTKVDFCQHFVASERKNIVHLEIGLEPLIIRSSIKRTNLDPQLIQLSPLLKA